VDSGVEEAAERFHGEVRERHESLRHDRERPLCTPAEVFLLPNEIFAAVKAHPSIMVLGPLAERTDLIKTSTESDVVDNFTFDATMTISGTTEMTNKTIRTISILNGSTRSGHGRSSKPTAEKFLTVSGLDSCQLDFTSSTGSVGLAQHPYQMLFGDVCLTAP
jgi:hypothetical protein